MGICCSRCRSKLPVLENPPDSVSPPPEESLTVSLYDFPSFDGANLIMTVGERLTVISEDGGVMMVRSMTTNRESYIPTNYTANVTHGWFFTGLSRHKAEELLMRPQNQNGSFLVRASETKSDCFSLSIRWQSSTGLSGRVKHYLIAHLRNGRVYVSPKCSFSSVKQLVEHYSESADGLCCRLREPCFIQGSDVPGGTRLVVPADNRTPTQWKDISRSVTVKRTTNWSDKAVVSEGVREAISSYLQMTDCNNDGWDT
nr:src-like-adapter 2 [Nerophis lumbriciformis]XP_061779857.1 src-like-adapter 2 [Nerophis lumbriciformis]